MTDFLSALSAPHTCRATSVLKILKTVWNMELLSLLEGGGMVLKMNGRVTSNKSWSADLTILCLLMLLGQHGSCDKPSHLHNEDELQRKYLQPSSSVLWKGVWWTKGWNPTLSAFPGFFVFRGSLTNGAAARGENRLPLALLGGPTWTCQSFGKLRKDVAWRMVGCFQSTPGPWVCTSPPFGLLQAGFNIMERLFSCHSVSSSHRWLSTDNPIIVMICHELQPPSMAK